MYETSKEKHLNALDESIRFWLLQRTAARLYFVMPFEVSDQIREFTWQGDVPLSSVLENLGIYDNVVNYPSELDAYSKARLNDFLKIAMLKKIPYIEDGLLETIDSSFEFAIDSKSTKYRFEEATRILGMPLIHFFKIVLGFLYPYEGAAMDYAYSFIRDTGVLKEMLPIETLHPDAYYWSEVKNVNVAPYGGKKDIFTYTTRWELYQMDTIERWANVAISYFIGICFNINKSISLGESASD